MALEVARALPAPPAPPITTVRDMRKVLRSFVRGAWATDVGAEMSERLSEAASSYAARLREAATDLKLSDLYQSIAEATDVGNAYRQVWGKPPKPPKKRR